MTTTFSLTTQRETLLSDVETALAPVERKNTIPVLANLLLDEAESGTLRLSGTDLDVMTSVETAIEMAAMPRRGSPFPQRFCTTFCASCRRRPR
jgi:DNA polymerase III sliding clamp (beta) subunit (PCNA family)